MTRIPRAADTEISSIWTGTRPSEGTLAAANEIATRLPDLLIAADRIAANMVSGLHGRRRVGTGENFWQFRQFVTGDYAARVDWRRSGRGDTLFIREQEWDTPQTVWLWCDTTASMRVKSNLVSESKLERGLTLMFALARLLSNAGENIGLLGQTGTIMGRHAPARLADELAHHLNDVAAGTSLPDCARVMRHADVVVLADFLTEEPEFHRQIKALESTGGRIHLMQILDPLEDAFPFRGRIEFRDPESGQRLVAGKAEEWRAKYLTLIGNLRQVLVDNCVRRGWRYQLHLTDKPATAALLSLHQSMSSAYEGSNRAP